MQNAPPGRCLTVLHTQESLSHAWEACTADSLLRLDAVSGLYMPRLMLYIWLIYAHESLRLHCHSAAAL